MSQKGGKVMLSTIADIIGIVSFLLTLVLLVRSEAIRKEIENQLST